MSAVTSTNALAKDSTLQDVADAISTMGATSVGNLSALTTTDKTSLVGAVNEVKSGLTKGYLVKTFNVEGHANDTSIDFSALKPSDFNGFVNAYSINGSGLVVQKCKNDVMEFLNALPIDATITVVYTVSQ